MPSDWDPLPFCIDHVIDQQHAGPTIESNLALSCFSCNTHKGPNIAGLDPATGQLTRLFHPRGDTWIEHFDWIGPALHGKSPIGRVTLQVLNINDPVRVEHRRVLLQEGVLTGRRPPS
ncbi:MAG: HNH endonuclease [Pirellulaceae bacterium]|nr:HNH endonuclease [Pirellulaceae bacterium]